MMLLWTIVLGLVAGGIWAGFIGLSRTKRLAGDLLTLQTRLADLEVALGDLRESRLSPVETVPAGSEDGAVPPPPPMEEVPVQAICGVGGFAVPLLVRSSEPNAIGLFSYLLLLVGGSLVLLRWRKWWWLAWCVLAAAAGWVALWVAVAWERDSVLPLSLFLCGVAGMFAAFRLGLPAIPRLAGRAEGPMVRDVLTLAAVTVALLALVVVTRAEFSPAALVLPVVLAVGFVAFAWFDPEFDRLPWGAAVMAVLVLVSWNINQKGSLPVSDLLSPIPPVMADRFAWTGLAFAGLFGFAGLAAVAARVLRPWRWAVLSAGAPLIILAVAYWRLSQAYSSWGWAMGGLALGVVFVSVAERVARRRKRDGMEGVLAAYAVGTLGALALAATMALEEAWLSVALAVLPVGVAWVDLRLRVYGLRHAALLLAAVVLVRLAINPYVLSYPLTGNAAPGWLLYGYGIPALAFAVAARLFRRSADDALVAVLEAGTVAFAVLLASLEIRHLMVGGLSSAAYSLTERSLHTVSWLTAAAILFAAHGRGGRRVALRAGQILLALGAAQAVLLQAIWGNPLLTGQPVGATLVLDPLLLCFAAPALLFAIHARVAPVSPPWVRVTCAVLAVVFAFLWASLETRHAFVGSRLDLGPVGQPEQWAYSALWLTGGILVFLGGVLSASALFRWVGLAIVMVVVAKVFLVDMSHTTGIWRALSFLGLGVGLVGTGWLYRRFSNEGRTRR